MPYKIWSSLEGGLIASFGTDAKSKVMVSKDVDIEDECLVLEALTDKYVKYFKCVFHRNTWYFLHFVLCKFRFQKKAIFEGSMFLLDLFSLI